MTNKVTDIELLHMAYHSLLLEAIRLLMEVAVLVPAEENLLQAMRSLMKATDRINELQKAYLLRNTKNDSTIPS